MDAAFARQAGSGASFLSTAGHALGCVYICLWSHLPQPANCLASTEGWFHEDNQSPSRRLFDLYRRSFFNIETGHFPGLAFKEGLDYLEVDEPRLTSLAGIPSQRDFYQEAGIKIAVFMARRDGEIELGWSENTSVEVTRERIMDVFSLPSLDEDTAPRRRNLAFRSPENEEKALIMAFLNVLSSSPSSSLHPARRGSAFSPYSFSPRPIYQPSNWIPAQRMMKRVFSIMGQIESMKSFARAQGSSQSGGGHLHHVISERKRREKLNESFAALRSLLPPDPRKDRASLLRRARDSMIAMKEEISSLEEKNRTLEAHLKAPEEPADEAESSGERVEIRINRCSESSSSASASSSSSSSKRIELRISIRVKCDAVKLLIWILACLKDTGNIKLISMEAHSSSRHESPLGVTIFTFQIDEREWDEAAFKEAVCRAVDYALSAGK